MRLLLNGATEMRYEDIEVGQDAEIVRTITEADLRAFAELTGDMNPLHVDAEYCGKTSFGKIVAHGMLTASLVAAVIGTKLPGPGALELSQDIHFLKPVWIGDTLRVVAKVKRKSPARRLLVIETVVYNQNGERVLAAEGMVMALPDIAE